MDITAFTSAVSLAKTAISIVKGVKDLLPDSKDKQVVTQMLEQAERNFKIAEAEAARGLGYEICKCTWPPQIMTETKEKYHFQCPQCGQVIDKTPRMPRPSGERII